MSRHHHARRCIPAALASVAVLLSACVGTETTSASDNDPTMSTSPTADPAGPRDYVLLLDDETNPDQMRGSPGSYAMTARGTGEPPLVVVEVPGGYSNFGTFGIVEEGFGVRETGPFRALNYWTVYGVYANPCTREGGAPEAGASVEDLTDALAAQKLTTATKPVPVSIDGHDGVYVELRGPKGLDLDDCALAGNLGIWEASPGDRHHNWETPRAVGRLWIVDVEGHRIVLEVWSYPGVGHDEIGELTAIVESAKFVEPG